MTEIIWCTLLCLCDMCDVLAFSVAFSLSLCVCDVLYRSAITFLSADVTDHSINRHIILLQLFSRNAYKMCVCVRERESSFCSLLPTWEKNRMIRMSMSYRVHIQLLSCLFYSFHYYIGSRVRKCECELTEYVFMCGVCVCVRTCVWEYMYAIKSVKCVCVRGDETWKPYMRYNCNKISYTFSRTFCFNT